MTIQHEDKCRWWDDEEFCDCGALEVAKLETEIFLLRACLTAALQEKVNALSALNCLKETITLAAAPLGITGEPGEVVGKMGDEAKRLRGIVTALEDGCYKCQHPVRVRELTCQKNALQQVVSERDEEIASLRAQLLTAREQGRREGVEEAAKVAEETITTVSIYAQARDAETATTVKRYIVAQIRALSPQG